MPRFFVGKLYMGIKLNFGDFFFAKKLFFFPEMGKIGVKTGKIPKNSKKSQKIIGVEIFYFWT